MSDTPMCGASGCRDANVSSCAYVDRRSRMCRTSWCERHRSIVGGRDLCRRHATVMTALGSAPIAAPPDVDNRAATLAAYLGDELDARVTAVLGRAAQTTGAELVNHPLRLVSGPRGSDRRWQRSWNLVNETGVVRRVAIEVDECDDTVVMTTVGTGTIGRGTPPWIQQRGADLTGRRAAFVDAIGRSIELVLTRPEMASDRFS
ncbi:MAG: hypothetical protein ACREN2_01295 [Candidatus Dormibacteria bacterium]